MIALLFIKLSEKKTRGLLVGWREGEGYGRGGGVEKQGKGVRGRSGGEDKEDKEGDEEGSKDM